MERDQIISGIPHSASWVKIQPITAGWSHDIKYLVEYHDGHNSLIRMAPIAQYPSKLKEYTYLQKMQSLRLNIPVPLKIGSTRDNQYVFCEYSWLEGTMAEETIENLPDQCQYSIGFHAGEVLKQIHSLAPNSPHTSLEPWEARYRRKILRNIDLYKNCSIKLESGPEMIQFLKTNLHYLKNRPQCFQHGDFHLGNMLLSSKNSLGVIDFNRWDIGDPWEEFNRIIFSVRKSIPFAIGQIDGYFNHHVPIEFFRLMAIYIFSNTIGSIAWAIPYGEREIKVMQNNAQFVVESYNSLQALIPNWYKQKKSRS